MFSKSVPPMFIAALFVVFLEAKGSQKDDVNFSDATAAGHIPIYIEKRVRERRMAETANKPISIKHSGPCGSNPMPFLPVNYTAKTCVDHMMNGATHCGYYVIDDGTESYAVFCDINSEIGAAYTLVESFALKHNTKGFKNHPLTTDFPVRPNSPRFDYYRLPKDRMTRLADFSTYWRATCSFDQVGFTKNAKDYVRVKMAELNPVTFEGNGKCILVEEFQLRGRLEFSKTAAFWQGTNVHYHLVHGSSSNRCEMKATSGAVPYEDNWGYYRTINPKFSCTASPESTTQIWFGGSFRKPKPLT